MNRLILTIVFISTIFATFAQKIFSVDRQYQAEIKVYVVDAEYKADLVVFRTDKEYRAKANENKGIWFFTDKAYRTADFIIASC